MWKLMSLHSSVLFMLLPSVSVASELGFAAEITNPNGGAIALGHPVGASGAIILIKLMYELRRTGGRYGLATMCIGGGQGIAVIIENPEAKV